MNSCKVVYGGDRTRSERLPNWAYSDNELDEIARELVEPSRYCVEPKRLCWYQIVRDDELVDRAILLAVESVEDGQEMLDRLLVGTGLRCAVGVSGEPSALNGVRAEMIRTVLERHSYVPKAKFIGADKVFKYESWMANLV